jgi:ABC-type molybdate transport system permease subunit
MTPSEVGQLLGVVAFIGTICVAAAAVCLPFVVFSIAGSLRGIHRELQRANDAGAVVTRRPVVRTPAVAEEATAPTLSHRLTR